jgi:MFS family permease
VQSYEGLLASRLLQGVGATAAWSGAVVWLIDSAPPARRGELIGLALSATAAGDMLGPVLGGVAASVGRGATFAAAAAVAGLLALCALRFGAPRPGERGALGFGRALRSRPVWTGMWLCALPGVVFGAIFVLAPLQLDGLGASAGWIATTFAIAAAAGVLVQPLVGRWSDRRGRLRTNRVGLLVGIGVVLAIGWTEDRWPASALVVLALITMGALWGPAMALLSEASEAVGVGLALAAAIMLLAWTSGFIVGSAGGGALAEGVGRSAAYAVVAGALLIALVAIRRQRDPVASPVAAVAAR